MKIILVALSLVLVSSVTVHAGALPPTKTWIYGKQVDEFDDKVFHTVLQPSSGISSLPEGERFHVGVFCNEDTQFSSILFIIDSTVDDSSKNRIRLRFDSQEPQWFAVNFHEDGSSDFLSTKSVEDFKNIADKMRRHSTMKAEIYLLGKKRFIGTVDLKGFTEEFRKLPRYCQ